MKGQICYINTARQYADEQ